MTTEIMSEEKVTKKRKRSKIIESDTPLLQDSTDESEVKKRKKSKKKNLVAESESKQRKVHFDDSTIEIDNNEVGKPSESDADEDNLRTLNNMKSIQKKNLSEEPKKSKRSKKVDHVHESIGLSKSLRYLHDWKSNRNSWKFNKARQIWLLQNAYDDSKIPDSKFDVLLEYMASIKGRMKVLALERASKNIELAEKWEKAEEEESDKDLIKKLGAPKPTEKTLDRSKEIKIMLDDEVNNS